MAVGISEDEAALYDRQIRLWGVEAQNKMRSASVLIINFGALAAEITKNIVLAGIGELTIFDDVPIEPRHLGANYFLREEDLGKNRAEAAVDRVQVLNPRVSIKTVDSRSILSSDDFLGRYDIVILTDANGHDILELNQRTRRASKKMFACAMAGIDGWAFADLLDHEYLANEVRVSGHGETVTAQVKRQLAFCPFETTMGHSFANQKPRLVKKRPRGLWLTLATLNADITRNNAHEAARSYHQRIGCPVVIDESQWSKALKARHTEFPASIAVLGGVIGQDILNAIGSKEEPFCNLLVLDGSTCTASVHALGVA